MQINSEKFRKDLLRNYQAEHRKESRKGFKRYPERNSSRNSAKTCERYSERNSWKLFHDFFWENAGRNPKRKSCGIQESWKIVKEKKTPERIVQMLLGKLPIGIPKNLREEFKNDILEEFCKVYFKKILEHSKMYFLRSSKQKL